MTSTKEHQQATDSNDIIVRYESQKEANRIMFQMIQELQQDLKSANKLAEERLSIILDEQETEDVVSQHYDYVVDELKKENKRLLKKLKIYGTQIIILSAICAILFVLI